MRVLNPEATRDSYSFSRRVHWGIGHAGVAVAVGLLSVLFTSVAVGSLLSQDLLIATGALWILLFFALLTFYLLRPTHQRAYREAWPIFGAALLARVLAVLIAYFGFLQFDGTSFEPHASDSVAYHNIATRMAVEVWWGSQGFSHLLTYAQPSDLGYPIFLSLLYALMGPHVLVARFVQALLGAWTAVLVYRLVRDISNSSVAKTAGWLYALFPYLVYYTGLHLKETVMILLIVYVLYCSVRISTGRGRLPSSVLGIAIGIASLFFFRTFLAALLLAAVTTHLLLARTAAMSTLKRLVAAVAILGMLFIVVVALQPQLLLEISNVASLAPDQFSREWQDKERTPGVSVTPVRGAQPLAVLAAYVGPLPNLADIPGQENGTIQYAFSWIRLTFLFFAVLGVWMIFRGRMVQFSSAVVFGIAYAGAVGFAGHPFSHRFQLPFLPIFLILAAAGLHVPVNRGRIFRLWSLSLVLMGMGVLIWNYFKLAVRAV